MTDRPDQDDETLFADSPTEAAPRGDSLVGSVLTGRWEVLSLLGEGGMGAVYRARDRELEETVALKVLRQAGVTADAVERFRREVKLARRVSHRNVARVFEWGEEQGLRFFTMELIEGESLGAVLARSGALAVPRVLSIGSAIARGLAAAHEVGVVHRDLKPDNVMVAYDGRIAITDFGIAASFEKTGTAETTSFAGTPLYMAPEQVDQSHPITARTDLYAFGALLFELVTGRPPFHEASALATAAARLTKQAPDLRTLNPGLPGALVELVASCLARSPHDRPESATAIAAVLDSLDHGGPTISMKPPPGPRSPADAESSVTLSPWSARAKPRVRLAALPLHNQGAPEDAFMADGLTDDLIDALSTVPSMRVLSRGSTEKYAGRRDVDPKLLGQELSVDVIVNGSARRLPDGGAVLALRLISCEDGAQLWSHRIQVGPERLLQVNEDAARAIASALSLDVGRDARRLTDPAATELYLKARTSYREFSPAGATRAAELFEQALVVAPDDHVLLAGRALALARLNFFRGDHIAQALDAAARALAGAPHSGEAHLAMATVELQRARLPEAMREALQALRLSPSLGEAHQLVGRILAETGPLDAAERALALAGEIEPRPGLTQISHVHVLFYSGRREEARALHEAVGLSNSGRAFQVSRARLAWWSGDVGEARAAGQALAARDHERDEYTFGTQLAVLLVEPDLALEKARQPGMLAFIQQQSPRFALFILQLLTEFASQRDALDEGVRFLRDAVAAGLTDLMWMDHCPLLANLRTRPEWVALHGQVQRRADEVRALLPHTTRRP